LLLLGRNADIREQFYMLYMGTKFGLSFLVETTTEGVSFEVFTVAVVYIIVFWVVTPYRLLRGYCHF
jgi:glucan phosphoethanolaminetransferase (alkaline phosphatase superfamily)